MSFGEPKPQRAELFLDDFPEGFVFTAEPTVVTRDDIVAFAEAYDPQPFHLDDEAARDTPLGGIAASGWHTAAIGMRLIYDTLLWRTACLGAPGIDEVRWTHPVRPGDHLTLSGRVTSARASQSRPDRGIVAFTFAMHNQDGVCVMTQANSIMVGRREGAAAT